MTNNNTDTHNNKMNSNRNSTSINNVDDNDNHNNNDTPLLDARSPGEFAKGHVPGAPNSNNIKYHFE